MISRKPRPAFVVGSSACLMQPRPKGGRLVREPGTLWALGSIAAEAAYRRGDLFDKRRKLMDAWAGYCATPKTGKVVAFRRLLIAKISSISNAHSF